MKILLLLVSVVCVVQAKIVIQVIQEVGGGGCGDKDEGEGGEGDGEDTTAGLDLNVFEDQLDTLTDELNDLQDQADAAAAAGSAADDAANVVQDLLNSLNSGNGGRRRRHRRSTVDFDECDPDVSLDGELGDVIVAMLDAVAVELENLPTSLDPTMLNCYLDLLNTTAADIAAGDLEAPTDTASITASANAASEAASAAQTAVADVAQSLAASIAAAEAQIAETQAVIEQAANGGAVETTTQAEMNSTEEQTTPSATDAVPDCNYAEFTDEHTMLRSEADCDITSSGVTEEEIADILLQHNNHRLKVASGEETQGDPGPQPGAANMREMVWNEELARVAEAWAKQCPSPNSNDCDDCRKICSRDYKVGQNIYHSYGQDAASFWKEAIDSWYSEVKDMAPFDVMEYLDLDPPITIRHYSQIVWAETYEVGCGRVHYSVTEDGEEFPESKIYVCNYGPAGNILEHPVYKDGEMASQCTDDKFSDNYVGLCA